MPLHPEMIFGDEIYEGAVSRMIQAIGADTWEEMSPEVQERIKTNVIENEREKINQKFRERGF